MGTFRVFEDGQLVAQFDNTLTTFGRSEILKMVTGHAPPVAILLVGGDATSPAQTDKTLNLPIAAEKVVFSTPVGITKIVYKARLNESVGGVIHEMAASNDTAARATKLVNVTPDIAVSSYDPTTVFVAGEGADPKIRISPVAVELDVTANADDYYTYNLPVSLAGALDSDTIALSGYNSANGVATFTVRFTDTNGNTATKTAVSLGAAGNADYAVASFAISSMTFDAGFDRGFIVKTEIIRTDATAILSRIDGLVLRSEQVGGRIISRASTGTGIAKRLGSKMDIEYEIPVTFT
jgi:hypothetical protein